MTWLLIALNVLAFAPLLRLSERDVLSFYDRWALIPAEVGLATFLTSMFLHGGLAHLIGNLWTLWIFGDNVEDRMGRGRFLVFYLLCGLIAGAVHYAFNADSPIPTVGASGAISGVLGAYFLLFPKATLLLLVPIFFYPLFVTVPAVLYLAFWFLAQFLSGTAALGSGPQMNGGVAWWAHIGGFIAGVFLLRHFMPSNGGGGGGARSPVEEGLLHPEHGRMKRPWSWEAGITGRQEPPHGWSARGRPRR